MNKLIYQGQWPGKTLREFSVTLPNGTQANFSVKPGEDLKVKLTEVQQRFGRVKAA